MNDYFRNLFVLIGLAGFGTLGTAQELVVPETLTSLQNQVQSVAALVQKSCVAIRRVRQDPETSLYWNETFRGTTAFGEGVNVPILSPKPTDPDFLPRHYGAGAIIDGPTGLILTTADVVPFVNPDINTNKYYITPIYGTTYSANVVGRDPRSGLAVLQAVDETGTPISLTELGCTEISLTDSPQPPSVGSFVVLMSNPLCAAKDGTLSASWGIIANTERHTAPRPSAEIPSGRRTLAQYGSVWATDIPSIPGREGGPLVDLAGNCVGIAIGVETLPGIESTQTYIIPIDTVFRRALQSLREGREVGYGFLGLEMRDSPQGVLIQRLLRGVPAEAAGIRSGDTLVAIDGVPMANTDAVVRQTSWYGPDAVISVTVQHPGDSEPVELSVPLIQLPVAEQVVTQKPPAWRGIEVASSTIVDPGIAQGAGAYRAGAVIVEIADQTLAEQAGLQRGMIVTAVADQTIRNPEDFRRITREISPEIETVVQISADDSQTLPRTIPATN